MSDDLLFEHQVKFGLSEGKGKHTVDSRRAKEIIVGSIGGPAEWIEEERDLHHMFCKWMAFQCRSLG